MTDEHQQFPAGTPGRYRARLHAQRAAVAATPSGPTGSGDPAGWRPIPTAPADPVPSALHAHRHMALRSGRSHAPDGPALRTAPAPAPVAPSSPSTSADTPSPASTLSDTPSPASTLSDTPSAGSRHPFGPDGPDDPPSYERTGEDPESYGDAASMRARWPQLDRARTAAPWRLRDHLPRGRQLARMAVIVVALVVLGTAAGSGLLYARADLAGTNAAFTSNTTALYYGDGKTPLSTLAVQNRTTIPNDRIPASMRNAAVAAENRSYWTDPGISVQGMARALVAMASGKPVQGGSTITQQYVKLVYLSQDRTITRKVREIAYALKLANNRSKDQILGDYLNTVFFGRDAYGVQAAAQAWFGTDAQHLTIGQSAVLGAVIQNSSILDPSIDPENLPRLQARYEYVLSGMLEMGTITRAEYDRFHGHLPATPVQTPEKRYQGPEGFLVNMVEQELKRSGFSEAQINGGGLRVTTTFDPRAQQAAQDAAATYQQAAAANAAPSPGTRAGTTGTGAGSKGSTTSTAGGTQAPTDVHAAVASVDSRTGEVLALYGGDDFVKNSRNWATTPRMTGSTFKAFGLAAGLRDGFTLRSTFNGNTFQLDRQPMPVRNEFNTEYGPAVSLQYATQESINTAFVDMVHQMPGGPKKVMQAANDAGAPNGTGWGNYDRMVLGEPEVSPLNMATAYATLTNGGLRHTSHVVREVRDMQGKVLYTADTKGEQTVEPDVAANTTYALQQVTRSGTGASVSTLGRPVAGKTGTAGVEDKIFAAWFVGATTRVSTAVMYVAGSDGQADLDPYAAPGDRTFFGAGYPAKTWLSYMTVATKGDPVERFAAPTTTGGRPRAQN